MCCGRFVSLCFLVFLSPACRPGSYKASATDAYCTKCPSHSSSHLERASECVCEKGFHRAETDPRSMACTREQHTHTRARKNSHSPRHTCRCAQAPNIHTPTVYWHPQNSIWLSSIECIGIAASLTIVPFVKAFDHRQLSGYISLLFEITSIVCLSY